MNAAKKIILLLWLVLVASLGNASALTPGATENRTWEKSLVTAEMRLDEPLQTAGRHQENEGAGYDYAPDSLLAAEGGGGLFKLGEEGAANLPMTMETVTAHAEAGGVGLDGINVKILDAPPGFYGWSNPNGAEIHLYPSAFQDSETLIRTLGHERTHAFQFQTFGDVQDTIDAGVRERAAIQSEDSFFQYSQKQ